jgi:hypothetical protein
MSTETWNQMVQADETLSRAARRVANTLAVHATCGSCVLSNKQIADEAGVVDIKTNMQTLRRRGLIMTRPSQGRRAMVITLVPRLPFSTTPSAHQATEPA